MTLEKVREKIYAWEKILNEIDDIDRCLKTKEPFSLKGPYPKEALVACEEWLKEWLRVRREELVASLKNEGESISDLRKAYMRWCPAYPPESAESNLMRAIEKVLNENSFK